jgi:hypothetical protein
MNTDVTRRSSLVYVTSDLLSVPAVVVSLTGTRDANDQTKKQESHQASRSAHHARLRDAACVWLPACFRAAVLLRALVRLVSWAWALLPADIATYITSPCMHTIAVVQKQVQTEGSFSAIQPAS